MKAMTVGCLLLCATARFGLAQASLPYGTKTPERMPTDTNPLKIRIDDGEFTIELPQELKQEDPKAVIHSYRSIPAFSPPHTAEEVGKDPCSHTLLLAGIGGDPEPELDSRGKKTKFVASPPAGGISIVEVDDNCAATMKEEDVLSRLAIEAQEVDGRKPTARMISYVVDDHPVWLAMSGGNSKDEKGKRTAKAGMTLVANVSLKSHRHYFVVGLIANDKDLFKRLMQCRIQFTGKPSSALIPFQLSADKNIRDAVPK